MSVRSRELPRAGVSSEVPLAASPLSYDHLAYQIVIIPPLESRNHKFGLMAVAWANERIALIDVGVLQWHEARTSILRLSVKWGHTSR